MGLSVDLIGFYALAPYFPPLEKIEINIYVDILFKYFYNTL